MQYRTFGALRLLLAILVMGQHFGWLLPDDDGYKMASFQTGDIAVVGFFILSGLIITEAAVQTYSDRPMAFATNRFLRIVPPLVFAMLLSIIGHAVLLPVSPAQLLDSSVPGGFASIFSVKNILANAVSMVPGLGEVFRPDYRLIPYTWAIRVELQFYALLFIALYVGRALGLGQVLIALALLAIAGAIAYHFGLVKVGALRYQPYFALGGALLFALRGNRTAAVIATAAAAVCLYDFAQVKAVSTVRPWAAQYLLLVGSVVAMCALFFTRPGAFRSWDKRLGDLSYPLYLNQYIVIIVLSVTVGPGWATFLVSLPIAFALAALAVCIIEPWTVGARDKIRGTRLDTPASISPAPQSEMPGQAKPATS